LNTNISSVLKNPQVPSSLINATHTSWRLSFPDKLKKPLVQIHNSHANWPRRDGCRLQPHTVDTVYDT